MALGAKRGLVGRPKGETLEQLTLREYFEIGRTTEAFEELLDEDQLKLHRLHGRRAKIDDGAVEAIRTGKASRVLIITEPWCGDSLAIFPVVAELFCRAGLELRVIRRDEHPDLIDRYLTRGGRAIPIVLVLDEASRELLRWGPRPHPAQLIVEAHREDVKEGRIERTEVHKKVRAFYSGDCGKTVVQEFVSGLV